MNIIYEGDHEYAREVIKAVMSDPIDKKVKRENYASFILTFLNGEKRQVATYWVNKGLKIILTE